MGRCVVARGLNEELVYFDASGRELLRIAPVRMGMTSVRISSQMANDVRMLRVELLTPAAAHAACETDER